MPSSGKIASVVPAQHVVHVADAGQRVVVDLDQLGAVLGQRPAVGHHDGDRVADQAHGVTGQRREGRQQQVGRADRREVGGHAVEVGGGEHRPHPGHGQRLGDVDAPDPGVRERAAHEGGVQHAGQGDVVDVAAPAGEDARVLDPLDAGAGEPGDHQASLRSSAARSTPSTMLS